MSKTLVGNSFMLRLTLGLAAALLPATLWAQSPGKGPDKGPGKGPAAPAKDDRHQPGERHGDPMAELSLSKDQEMKIQKLRAEMDNKVRPLFDEQRRLMEAAEKAWTAPRLDKGELKKLQKKLRIVQTKMEDSGFDLQMKMGEVLTPEQRKKMIERRPPHPRDRGDKGPPKGEKANPQMGKPGENGHYSGGPGAEHPPHPPMGPGMGMFGICPPPPPPPADQERPQAGKMQSPKPKGAK